LIAALAELLQTRLVQTSERNRCGALHAGSLFELVKFSPCAAISSTGWTSGYGRVVQGVLIAMP
jgi:hypothetical protein